MVPPLLDAGALTFSEREAPFHRLVLQEGGEEAQASVKGGAAVEFGEGLPVLRVTVEEHGVI